MYFLQLIRRSKSLQLKLRIHYPPDAYSLMPPSAPLFLPSHAAERSFLMGSFSEELKQELPNEHPSTSANTKNTLRNRISFFPSEAAKPAGSLKY